MTKRIKIILLLISSIIFILIAWKSIGNYRQELKFESFNDDYYNLLSTNPKTNLESDNVDYGNMSLIHNNKSVPVLMYHSIRTQKNNPYMVSPARFDKDMQYIHDNGFTTLSTEELYDFMVYNKPIPKKSILITFDDGYEDNYTNAFPILKKYNIKATIFIITDYVDKGKQYLSSAQLKEMESNGIDIESHTYRHDKLATYDYYEQLNTLKASKEFIEKTLDKKVNFISYPFGSYNIDTLKALKEAGYEMAFTTDGRWANKSNGILTLNRVFISGFHRNTSFKTRVRHSWYIAKYLYFW